MKSETKALKIAELADDKKALNTVVLDLRNFSSFCDFFVIASGTSTTHNKAIADGITKKMREEKTRASHREGYAEATWIVLDYNSVIVHIFNEENRNFYDLEHLWGDAVQLQ
ncbi:MAG: ribosome silencing factor [PVC group bacterium]|nr:ribosome silencing factor [PVC group bacterium]